MCALLTCRCFSGVIFNLLNCCSAHLAAMNMSIYEQQVHRNAAEETEWEFCRGSISEYGHLTVIVLPRRAFRRATLVSNDR